MMKMKKCAYETNLVAVFIQDNKQCKKQVNQCKKTFIFSTIEIKNL